MRNGVVCAFKSESPNSSSSASELWIRRRTAPRVADERKMMNDSELDLRTLILPSTNPMSAGVDYMPRTKRSAALCDPQCFVLGVTAVLSVSVIRIRPCITFFCTALETFSKSTRDRHAPGEHCSYGGCALVFRGGTCASRWLGCLPGASFAALGS